jgi:hypothetical protein
LLDEEIYRGTWYCEHKKSLKEGEITHFQTLVFAGKKIPQYNGRYQLLAQIGEFVTRPNLHGVH